VFEKIGKCNSKFTYEEVVNPFLKSDELKQTSLKKDLKNYKKIYEENKKNYFKNCFL